MPKLRRLSGADVVAIFQRFGFVVVSQRGSHVKLKRASAHGTETLTVSLLYYYEEGHRNITAVIAVIQLGLVMGLLLLERLTRPREVK